MKISLLLFLLPLIGYSQIQIGQDLVGNSNNSFGKSVVLSSNGNILAIGSRGKVKIFELNNESWEQVGQDINGDNINDEFGHAIALSNDGSIIAIAAIYYDFANNSDVGQVKVFKNINNVWTQIGDDLLGMNELDWFGFSISLNSTGDTIAVGIRNNSDGALYAGQVKVFKNINNQWIQMGQNLNGVNLGDWFGWSVSLSDSGNTLAASGTWADGIFINSGVVKVFEFSGNNWIQIGQNIEGAGNSDYSGGGLSLSSDGNILAVGSSNNDNNALDSGHVRIFSNNNGNWVQIGQNIEGVNEYDNFGSNLSLSGDGSIIAISARYSDNDYENAGEVKIFHFDSNTWNQIGTSIFGEETENNLNVISLSENGTRLAVGNRNFNSNTGKVKVYDLISTLNLDTHISSIFSIYPNPSSEILNVYLKNNWKLEKINFYNNLGQLIMTSKTSEINISHLPNGIYCLELITDYEKIITKIVKQ